MREALLFCIIGIVLGGGLFWLVFLYKKRGFEELGTSIVHEAEKQAQIVRSEMEMTLQEKRRTKERELEAERQQWLVKQSREEERLEGRQKNLEARVVELDKREKMLHKEREKLLEQTKALETRKADAQNELASLSGLTQTQACEKMLLKAQEEISGERALWAARHIEEAKEGADREAKRILITAIQRLAVPCVSETTLTTVTLPSEEMKGRIIGREGRNIRAFEQAAGVNLLIDETPQAIVISGFDPLRKAIARRALADLIAEGRIHPTRIEEALSHAEETIHEEIKERGEQAALRAQVFSLHPELLKLLGRLSLRTSYRQNVLDHSVEVSGLMGLMAAELELDSGRAKRIGLLHDIGKALSHEREGSHALVGYEIVKKYGESEEVANGVGCHHGELDPLTFEGSLCGTADALSGARPGARIEAVEEYFQRLRKLETLSSAHPGVEKAFILQAGREVRVLVTPDHVDDRQTTELARQLAKKIEKELSYPGKIKVTVIRETKVVEYAL